MSEPLSAFDSQTEVIQQTSVEDSIEHLPAIEDPGMDAWRHADVLYANADHIAAAEAYQRAATISVSDAARRSTLLYNAALCWLQAGQLEQAVESLKQALEGSAESRSVRLASALACFRLERHADAAEHCNQILAVDLWIQSRD